MIKLKDLLTEISFQKVTVKDKKGKSHTQQARIRRGTTHVLIIHWKAIEKTSFSSAKEYPNIKKGSGINSVKILAFRFSKP